MAAWPLRLNRVSLRLVSNTQIHSTYAKGVLVEFMEIDTDSTQIRQKRPRRVAIGNFCVAPLTHWTRHLCGSTRKPGWYKYKQSNREVAHMLVPSTPYEDILRTGA